MLTHFFQNILFISLTLSIVILLLTGFYLLISRRYAAKWRMFLWAALALRLILPFNLSFDNAPIQLNIPAQQEIVVESPSSPPATQTIPPPVNSGVTFEIHGSTGDYIASKKVSPLPQTVSAVKTVIVDQMTILSILWLCGLLLALSVRLIKYYRFRRYVKRYGRAITQNSVLSRLSVMKAALSIHTTITPLLVPQLKSPTVTGCIKPVLLLPTTDYTETEWNAILSHELTHYKRGDLWLKLLFWAAELLHWFNPLVYLVSNLANRDMELACDAAVVSNTSLDNKKCYSHAILSALEKTYFNPCRRPYLATGFDGGKRTLKGRFASIFEDSKKKKGIFALIAVIVVIAIVGACFAFQPGGVEQTNETLTIWMDDPRYISEYKEIIDTFKSEHPDVVVTVAEMPDPVYEQSSLTDDGVLRESLKQVEVYMTETLPAYYEKLRADMIVGKGPDIMLFKPEVFNDLHKSIAAGAFCDLNPLLEADPDYKPEDYQQSVLSAGAMNGKQFVMPLFYRLPGIATTKEAIEEGFAFSEKDGYYNVIGKTIAYLQSGGKLPVDGESYIGWSGDFLFKRVSPIGYTSFTNTVEMNYEKQSIRFDEVNFKQLQEWNKILYHAKKAEELSLYSWGDSAPDIPNQGGDRMYHKIAGTAYSTYSEATHRLLYPYEKMESCIATAGGIKNRLNYTPVIEPIRDANGKIQATAVYGAAIRNNSENKQNAYDFLKLVMSPKMQMPIYRDCYTPIYKETADRVIDYVKTRNNENAEGKIDDAYYEQWKGWLDEIDGATFETKLDDCLWEYFEPFYKDEKSYEDCLQTAKDQLEIYISE